MSARPDLSPVKITLDELARALPERIASVDQSRAVAETAAIAARERATLDKQRLEATKPHRDAEAAINQAFRSVIDAAKAVEGAAKRLLLRWQLEERERVEAERRRVEAENRARIEAARVEEERRRKAIEEETRAQAADAGFSQPEAEELAALEVASADVAVPVLTEVAPLPPAATIVGGQGSATIAKVGTFAVVDPALVPREYLIVSEGLIRQAVRDGVRQIAGVTIYQHDQVRAR